MSLRLNDVHLRGCGFTLYPAADDFNVSRDVMRNILTSIYDQLGALNDDFEKQEEVKKENPLFPEVLTSTRWLGKSLEEALDLGLLEVTEKDGYLLTNTAISIFERASEIQKEFYGNNDSCIGCVYHDLF